MPTTAAGTRGPRSPTARGGSRNALRGLGLAKGERVAVLSPNAPMILEAHFGVPAAGLQLVAINTRLASDEIGYILRHSGARVLLVDHELESLVAAADVADLLVVRCDDTGAGGLPVRGAAGRRLLRRSELMARRRGGAHLDQLHVGHYRPAEGRAVHASRRVPECDGRVRRGGAVARVGVPVDAADVPLQRLVLPVGGDGGRRDARDDAQGRPRRGVAADRRRGSDALLRRPDRATVGGRPPVGAPRRAGR